jgi:hypothetical protein
LKQAKTSKKQLMHNLPLLPATLQICVAKWAEKIGKDTLDNYSKSPLTPVLTGALRSAGSVFLNGYKVKQTKKNLTKARKPPDRDRLYYRPAQSLPSGVKIIPNTVSITWVVNTPYAMDPRFPQTPYRGPEYFRVAMVVESIKGLQRAPTQIMNALKRQMR